MKYKFVFLKFDVIGCPAGQTIYFTNSNPVNRQSFVSLVGRDCRLTVSGLAKVAIFTTNVDAENQTLINHKCVCGALNRHFCQTAVTCWRSSVRYVSCRCQLKYVVKNMILKYVQSNENIMCINVSNFFPFHRSVE